MNALRKSDLKIDLIAGVSTIATISDDRLWMALAKEALRVQDIPDLKQILEQHSPESTELRLSLTQINAIRDHIRDHREYSARKLKAFFPYVSMKALSAFIGAFKRSPRV